jgi:hypothetical protein
MVRVKNNPLDGVRSLSGGWGEIMRNTSSPSRMWDWPGKEDLDSRKILTAGLPSLTNVQP